MHIHKNYFKSQFFYKFVIEESGKSRKKIANPQKLIGSANNFLENSKTAYKNRREIQKYIFKGYLRQQLASVKPAFSRHFPHPK